MVTVEEVGLTHQPDRATYLCLGCDRAWPCDPAREYLVESLGYDLPMLYAVMWNEIDYAALGPLRHEPVGVLAERLLRWIPSSRTEGVCDGGAAAVR